MDLWLEIWGLNFYTNKKLIYSQIIGFSSNWQFIQTVFNIVLQTFFILSCSFLKAITKGTDHESPLLPSLVDMATRYTSAREMSADTGYQSKKNVDYIASKGMIPYIMPKKNVRTLNRGSSGAWGSMIKLWKEYPDLFKLHYHQRSNSEASIGMIKRKLGYYTRAKNHTAQVNDILARIVCLNAAILAEAMLEFNLSPVFTDG